MITFFDTALDTMAGQIDVASAGLRIQARNAAGTYKPLNLRGSTVQVTGTTTVTGNTIVDGDLVCTGEITAYGGKPASQPTENYGIRKIYAVESPELLYYDRGRAQLVNGECTVFLDPIFLECIEADTDLTPWTFWVESYGENEVYVYEWGTDYFKVKERNNGTSDNRFAWRFEANRKGYAGVRMLEVKK
jgi:hypothetical protein